MKPLKIAMEKMLWDILSYGDFVPYQGELLALSGDDMEDNGRVLKEKL